MVGHAEFKYDDFYNVCNIIFSLTNLDVKLIDQEENILLQLDSLTMPASLQKTDIKYFKMCDTLQKHPPTSYYYHTNTYGLDYITVGIWRNDIYYGAIIVGPFVATIPDDAFISNVISKNNLPVSEHKPLLEFYKSLAIVSSSTANSIGATLVNLSNHTYLKSQLITSSSLNPTRNKEKLKDRIMNSTDIIEFRYKKEKELMDYISRGDKEKIKKLPGGFSDIHLDKRIPESPIRGSKNLLIVLNTLCRIAAENGGVHPIYIHNISEKFAILIERAPNLPYLNDLSKTMLEEYCDLVSEYSTRKYSAIVKKAVNYIKLHLDSPLTLQGIAETIHVNASHLSRKFKDDTGMSLIDFINLNRVEAAKVYLQNNTSSITEIAFIVGFNDVNYFSRVFKKVTGLTPSQYRRKHSTGEELE
ncbi:MAG: helix-turn-helix domain-containing protein [Lysinibacillus sp.]